jgi:hypothetical protein
MSVCECAMALNSCRAGKSFTSISFLKKYIEVVAEDAINIFLMLLLYEQKLFYGIFLTLPVITCVLVLCLLIYPPTFAIIAVIIFSFFMSAHLGCWL